MNHSTARLTELIKILFYQRKKKRKRLSNLCLPNLWQTFYYVTFSKTWRYITTSVSSRYRGSCSRENTPRAFYRSARKNIGFRRYLHVHRRCMQPAKNNNSMKTPVAMQQQWTRTKEVKGPCFLKPFKEHCRSLVIFFLFFFFF